MTQVAKQHIGPLYRCHKLVHAVRIADYDYTTDAEHVVLRFDGGSQMTMPLAQLRGLEVGGYLVEYEDGYRSFSPAKAFEQGYHLVVGEAEPLTAVCGACKQPLPTEKSDLCPHCGAVFGRYTVVPEQPAHQVPPPALGAKAQINMLALTPVEARDLITQLQPIAMRGA